MTSLSYLRFRSKVRPTVVADGVSFCIDSIFRVDDPHFDGFQGFGGPGGSIESIAQGFQSAVGVSISTMQVRFGNVPGTQNGSVYVEIVEDSTPGGTVQATSNSVAVSSFNDVSGLVGGENLDSTHPLTMFTFGTPHVSGGGQLYAVMRITELVSSGVPSVRTRWGDPCSGGAGWSLIDSTWSIRGAGAFEGMNDLEIRVNP